MLGQQPSKIGAHEKQCVKTSLLLSVRLVVAELKWLNEGCGDAGGGGAMVDTVLHHVLDKNKSYFKQPGSGWNRASGLPRVRVDCIEEFWNFGGFAELLLRLAESSAGVGEPKHPISLESLQHVLVAANDTTFPVASTVAAATALSDVGARQRQDERVRICGELVVATTNVLRGHVDSGNRTEVLKQLDPTIQKLCNLCDELSNTTQRQIAMEFYSSWHDICIGLISSRSPSPSLEMAGWDQLGKLVRLAKERRPPPRRYVVSGAGSPVVNGMYEFAGEVTESGHAKVGREISYAMETDGGSGGGEKKKLKIFRCTMRSQKKWWFLSIPDPEQPGTDRDVDYYQHKCSNGDKDEEALPPSSGWMKCSAGIDPPPVMQAEGLVVPDGEEGNTLEDRLERWIVQNRVVEKLLGECREWSCNASVIRASTEALKFIARRNCLDESILIVAWSAVLRSKEAKHQMSGLCRLVAELLPLCPLEQTRAFNGALREALEQEGGDNPNDNNLLAVSMVSAELIPLLGVNESDAAAPPALAQPLKDDILGLVAACASHPAARTLDTWNVLRGYCERYDSDEESDTGGQMFVETPTNDDGIERYNALFNFGGTGYCDAVLQQLFMSNNLRNAVIAWSLPDGDVKHLELAKEFQHVFQHINAMLETPPLSQVDNVFEPGLRQGLPVIRSFLDTFDPSKFLDLCGDALGLEYDVREPNDAADFHTKLFDRVSAAMSRFAAPADIAAFDGMLTTTISRQKVCTWCDLCTGRDEKISSISLSVRDKSNLLDSFNEWFAEERMEEANRVRCERCEDRTDTILRTRISSLPELLVFDMKRFDLDFRTFQTVKLNTRYEFSELIDMALFCSDTEASTKYKLVGVVVHQGTASGGVYSSLVRERGPSGRWMHFEDKNVVVTASSHIEELCFGRNEPAGLSSTNARMLFYERV